MRTTLKMAALIACLLATSTTVIARDKKGAKKGGGREKIIVREAQSKGKDKSKIDFDETDIGGQVKKPMGSLINQNNNDKNYDLIKIRLRWHPEMIQSTAALESGG